jgi:hypothetical protein
MARLVGVREQLGRPFYRTISFRRGEPVDVLFENDRQTGLVWLALALRVCGATRDGELAILDYLFAEIVLSREIHPTPEELVDIANAIAEPYRSQPQHLIQRFHSYPGTLMQEPRGLVFVRPFYIPKGEKIAFGVKLRYGPELAPRLPEAIDVRPTLHCLETRDIYAPCPRCGTIGDSNFFVTTDPTGRYAVVCRRCHHPRPAQ